MSKTLPKFKNLDRVALRLARKEREKARHTHRQIRRQAKDFLAYAIVPITSRVKGV